MVGNPSRNQMLWWAQCLAGLVLLGAVLSGCASGAPGVVEPPVTRTPVQIAAAFEPTATNTPPVLPTPSPTSTTAATATAVESPAGSPNVTPTPKRKPAKTPVPGPTARPEPPEPDDPSVSQVISQGSSGRREVALTFDAGADRGFAEEILDTLADYGVVASFGITGHWAEENPDLVKRMVKDGHMIFNHTWSHRSWTGFSTADWDAGVLTSAERAQELTDTANVISELTDGYDTAPYFRPPYGDIDDGVLADLADAGYTITVMWSCDSFGWNGATTEEIVGRCGVDTPPGAIILLHVGAQSADANALPALIEAIQSQDLEIVTIEDLLQP